MAVFFNRNNVFNSNNGSSQSNVFNDITVTGTADIGTLIVRNNTTLEGNLQVNGTEHISGNLAVDNIISTPSIIFNDASTGQPRFTFQKLISFGSQLSRILIANPFIFVSQTPFVTNFSTTDGTLGSFNAGTGTFTPAFAGTYAVSFNATDIIIFSGPDNNVNNPSSFELRIVVNGTARAAQSLIPVPLSFNNNQVFGMSCSCNITLLFGDQLRFVAGSFKTGAGGDGANQSILRATITYLG